MTDEVVFIPYVQRVTGKHGTLELHVEYAYSSNATLRLPQHDTLHVQAAYSAFDLFECLTGLRADLQEHDIYLLCEGARVDVYPSRLSRDMSGGRQAYRMTMGKEVDLEDLVDIFQPANETHIGTVEEQRRFFEVWLES